MRVIASIVIGAGLLLTGSVAQAVDMGDLDVTIRVIDSDEHDPAEVTNDISLPDMTRETIEQEKSGVEVEKAETEFDSGDQPSREETGGDTEGTASVKDSTEEATQTRDSSSDMKDSTSSDMETKDSSIRSPSETEGGTETGGTTDK